MDKLSCKGLRCLTPIASRDNQPDICETEKVSEIYDNYVSIHCPPDRRYEIRDPHRDVIRDYLGKKSPWVFRVLSAYQAANAIFEIADER
jgi:hypothetical protein